MRLSVLIAFIGLLTSCSERDHGRRRVPDKDSGDDLPSDWFYDQRAYPTGFIDPAAVTRARAEAQRFSRTASPWAFVGPDNVGGRVTDVAMKGSRIFIAGAAGGIFRSDDAGATFVPTSELPSMSIGAIALDPVHPDTLWVGTGEANGSGDSYPGTGIYLTHDAGQSWQAMGLPRSQHIGRIAIDPNDPNLLYAAATGSIRVEDSDRGIYRSRDGGASWVQVLFKGTRVAGIDVALDPQHAGVVYAALWERLRNKTVKVFGGKGSGLFKSTDGGDTWMQLTKGLPAPSDTSGRIGISLAVSRPSVLYAIFDDTAAGFAGVYKTVDGGTTFSRTSDGALDGLYSSYGWWFGNVRVSPSDPDLVFALGLDLGRSTDGGKSWSLVDSNLHADQHALAIDAADAHRVFLGDDGGFWRSTDSGMTFAKTSALPITQFYDIAVDPKNRANVFGGAQDNGVVATRTGATSDWQSIYGGDGLHVVVDPVDSQIVYAEAQNGAAGISTDGGNTFSDYVPPAVDRTNWDVPLVLDPNDHTVLYYGANKLFRGKDGQWVAVSDDLSKPATAGMMRTGTITTVAIAPSDSRTIYAGTDDGNVWVSRSGGGSDWTLITDGLPSNAITRLLAAPDAAAHVYVTLSGFGIASHVFESTDAGHSWRSIGDQLPSAPVNVIIAQPQSHALYIGSDVGVFSSRDNGSSWTLIGTGLPVVPVLDLAFDGSGSVLYAGTHGRSIWSLSLGASH